MPGPYSKPKSIAHIMPVYQDRNRKNMGTKLDSPVHKGHPLKVVKDA